MVAKSSFTKAPRHKELTFRELKWTCDTSCFEFDTTDGLAPIEGIVGQHRAIKALKLGIDIEGSGYNIFITGLSGTGKQTTVKKLLEEFLPKKKLNLSDYVYVNNFRDQDHPTSLVLPAGMGRKFRNDLKSSIKFLQENIPLIFEKEPFLSQRKKLLTELGESQQKMLGDFEKKIKKDKLTIGQIKTDEVTRPELFAIIDNQPVYVQQIEEYVRQKKITKKAAENIVKKYAEHQDELYKIFKESIKLTQEYQVKLGELETKAVENLISATFDDLKNKYRIRKLKKYLDKLAEDILENLDSFKGGAITQKSPQDDSEDFLKSYEVNLILDNTGVKNIPVVIETSPTYSNLFGSIEKVYDRSGVWQSDFTKIRAGSILRANGGFLVINAIDAINEPGVWRTLKRVLLNGKLEIQDLSSLYQLNTSSLKPEPIEINCKVIMIGNNYSYSILSSYEDDFNKIFKIKAEFDYEMARSESALMEYARIIKKLIHDEKLNEFDKSAIGKIIEYGARYAGEQNKLTTRFAYIADLTREANFWAKDVGAKIVISNHVVQAYKSAVERHSLYESKLHEMYENNTYLIDTEGSRIGQINGLAVYGGEYYSFGKPSRITASVGLGNGSIINVEREAGLSGNTHNKGILIISGYFRGKFGMRFPLSFTASLVFEQGYGMIDGDSASVTEICALLSSISEIPIKQSLAITGSINQKGDIQPIGGVNEKIEGFFDICKSKGLNKKQGVIIPHQNVKDLMLKDEVVEAVKKKIFHIYPIGTVDEAIEILTGVKAGKMLKNQRYQAHTVYGEVERHLREMKTRLRPPRPDATKKDSNADKPSKVKSKK
ncbi:MAG: ATP-binding protein [Melioribacteraceae bacterium]|nr:ATP-binding protein [Melioribacteraceae bacterium]